MAVKNNTIIDIQDLNKNSTVATNIEQEYIVITYDKIKLALIEYENNKKYATSWWTYLGVTISFFLPYCTAEFRPIWIFSAELIQASFILVSAAFAVITVFSIIKRVKNHKKITIEYCASQIKNNDD